MDGDLEIRELTGDAEYAACVALQRQIWGEQFKECVPPTILRLAQMLGGMAAGAFVGGRLAGFVFGLTGVKDGEVVHWSDMLAVEPRERGRGIGERLKRYQRDTLLARGVRRVYWSFDPLDAKNAYINFNRLGVYAREYVADMYGQTDSPLHAGIGTDRLIAVWEITSERVAEHLAGTAPTPVHGATRVRVPADIHALKGSEPARAREWRLQTRALFLQHLPQYVVTGFTRGDDEGYYELTSASNFAM